MSDALPAFRRSGLALAVACLVPYTATAQERLWSVRLGTSADDSASAAIADGAGGVIVAGSTRGELGGPSAGGSDVWLARFDRHGTRLWLRQFGTGQDDFGYALAPDGAGGFFAAGGTAGGLGGVNAGGSDIWIGRFDASGHQLWLAQTGTESDERAFALASDATGGVFVAAGLICARYTASGTQIWSQSSAYTMAAAPNESGGFFAGGATGAPAWAGEFNSLGELVWRQFYNPIPVSLELRAIAVLSDLSGGAYAVGPTYCEAVYCGAWFARFNAAGVSSAQGFSNAGLSCLARDGAGGVFAGGSSLLRLDPTGATLWSAPVGGIAGLAPDGRGGVFAVGAASADAFVSRFGFCYANCDGSTGAPTLNVLDFGCFLNAFAAGSPYANCDGSTTEPVLNALDFACFLNRFAAGCS